MTGLLSMLVFVLIVGLVVAIIWWAMDKLGVPEPINKIVKVIVVLIAVIAIISRLLPMSSFHGF